MTHYTISYAGMTPGEMHDQAIRDVTDYLGSEDKYQKLISRCRAQNQISLDSFQLLVSFIGIAGYPARALYNEVWPYG